MLFKFSFYSGISTKNVELVINDFSMPLVISQWLKRQKCR